MAENQIDLTEHRVEANSIDLTPSVSAPPITDERELASVVTKTDYALGENSPGREEILNSHRINMQERFRELASVSESMRLRDELRAEVNRVMQDAVVEGRQVTPEELEYIRVLQERPVVPPSVALEKRFADRIVSEVFDQEMSVQPGEKAFGMQEIAGKFFAQQQIALAILQEADRKVQEQGWVPWLADLGKQLVPMYTPLKTMNVLEGGTSWWSGTNKAEQIQTLYLEPDLEVFEQKLRKAYEDLSADNPQLARAFINDVVRFSSSDAAIDNLFMSLDFLDVTPIALVVGAGSVGIAKTALRKKLQSTANELINPNLSKTDVAVLRGQAQEGAEAAVAADLSSAGILTGTRPERLVVEMDKTGNGFVNSQAILEGAERFTYEQQRRIRDTFERNKNILGGALAPGQSSHVVRLTPEATQEGFRLARQEQARLYPTLEDHVLRVENVNEAVDVFGGVDYVAVHYGKKDGTPFASEAAAANYAKRFLKVDPEMFVPTPHGDSWTLMVRRNVDETSVDLADIRLKTGYETPNTWMTGWLQALRMGDATRGPEASKWAKVATFGAQGTAERMAEVMKTIGRISKNEHDRLSDVMHDALLKHRTVVDPKTGQQVTVPGVFYHNQLELDAAYRSKGYSLPSQKETEAYWAFRQLMDYDLKQRNIGMWRDEVRQGIGEHHVGWVHSTKEGKEKIQLPPVEGKIVQELPRGGETFTIAWSDIKSGKSGFALSTSDRGWYGKVQELLKQDYKIIKLSERSVNDKALKDAVKSEGELVNYLVVRDWKERPLSMQRIPASEGGHAMYPQTGGYVKQAMVHGTGKGRQIYDGDMSIHHQARVADAKQLAEAYETARRMLLTNDPQFDTFAAANLPYDGKTLRAKFNDGTFDKNSPFVATEHGQRVSDVIKMDGVVDPSESVHSLGGTVSNRFAQQRSDRLTRAETDASQANPAFNLVGAPVMNPLKSMTRALSELARSRYFEDYVHATAETFMTQFGKYLDAPEAALRADPMKFIREPVWKNTADRQSLAAAKNARRNLLYMLGQDSYDLGLMKSFKQRLLDGVLRPYGKHGKWLERHQWTKDADPAVIARSAVFDLYLGLFNPLQFPLQAQGVTLVAAIDGSMTRAAQAAALGWMARMRGMASTNPGAQGLFSKATTKALGLPQHVVDEAYEVFLNNGMNTFGGAYSRLDDFLPTSLFESGKGPMGKFLDAGRFFFKEGEGAHRTQAFMTSYLRWKQAPGNLHKKPDARDIGVITERASLYYNDMSRASNSAMLSNSWLSTPAQFSTFHRNLADNLLGTRLTAAEKARVMLMYSTLYGVGVGNPVSLATAPLWPLSESIRQYSLENGIDTDSSFLVNAFHNGIAQAFLEQTTGVNYDTERYAPAGLPWLQDILSGDFLSVIQGPAGTGLGRMIETMAPFYYGLMSVFSESDDYYSVSQHDVIDLARNIASLNNVAKAYYAIAHGTIETKDGSAQMRIDAGPVDALLIGALGLTPQDVADAYLKIKSMKEDEEAKAALVKEAGANFRRGLKAAGSGDHATARQFFKNSKIILAPLNDLERSRVFTRMMGEHRTLVEKVDHNFYLGNPSTRGENYQRQIDRRYGE